MGFFEKSSAFVLLLFVIYQLGINEVLSEENDIPLSKISQKLDSHNPGDEIPLSKLGSNLKLTMNIQYCYSCGYRKVFDDYVGIIAQKYPQISVTGANYDPPGLTMYLSRIISIGKILAIMCILSRIDVFAFFNKPQPSWWLWCLENKVYACMMIFFLANLIEGQLISSGAFEITLNGFPMWSKLETGRIPQPSELFQIIDTMLQYTYDVPIHK